MGRWVDLRNIVFIGDRLHGCHDFHWRQWPCAVLAYTNVSHNKILAGFRHLETGCLKPDKSGGWAQYPRTGVKIRGMSKLRQAVNLLIRDDLTCSKKPALDDQQRGFRDMSRAGAHPEANKKTVFTVLDFRPPMSAHQGQGARS
jgi:hypothetical protein